MAAAAADSELRRSARRQLGKWAKIMCQIVGLERVAEELMGRREWTSYQEIMVGQETKGGEPICPATLRPNITIREGSRSPMAGGWYIRPSSPEPQPLDLSAKPPKPPASPNKTIFNVCSDDRAKPRLTGVGGRRSYTEDELQAALRDIQSGKLGTRRAAVIYGIPRSTLRNKVYKISQESRDPDDEESDAEEERETEQLLNRPLTVQDILRLSSEVRASCLQQLLSGASTSSEELPTFNGTPATIPTAQPLDFRRTLDNNNTTSADNNHPEEKKPPPQTTTTTTSNNNNNNNKPQQGGKGTRPKRGKYRNYDRDSLVEAVRAVQRGEMSVHRAGSYYGVPHSTLEYKVKERHLMRPRKREPKPRPPERKDPPPRPQPNGLVEPFEPRYPFPYWQAPFPLFGRPEIFARDSPQLTKSAREMAESLLETAEKGSFLDGIIRSSLDTPSRETGGKVLLEQLCRGAQMEQPASPPPPSPNTSHSPKDQQQQN